MRGRPLPWWLAVLLAAVLGAGAGGLAWSAQAPEDRRDELYGDPGDRTTTAVEALLESPVHVAPESQELLPPEDAEAIAEEIRARDLPVAVVVWQPSRSAGFSSPIQAGEDLAWALSEATGEPRAVVQWGTDVDGRLDTTPGWRWDPDVDYEQREPEFLGDPAPRLTEWVTGLPAGGEPLTELEPDLTVVSGTVLGLVIALPAVGVLAAVLSVVLVRLRRRAAPT